MINIVTGNRNSGKTSYLKKIYNKVGGDGVISEKSFENGEFSGYDITRLSDNRSKPFIRMKATLHGNWNEVFAIGLFSFSKEGYEFAVEALIEIDKEPIFIDEIGPLEILENKGFYDIVNKLLRNEKDIYITVRNTLLNEFYEVFGVSGKTNIITIR